MIATIYKLNGVDVSLSVNDTGYDSNCGDALAKMFAKVIEDFNFNPEVFIERLANELEVNVIINNRPL